jgi:hypothetical protein
MATLSEATSRTLDPDKYEAVTGPIVRTPAVDIAQSAPSFQRCPLPPVSVTPDSLRQFQTPGIPQTRTMTPSNTLSGGGTGTTTIISGTGTASTAGTSGGSAAAAAIQNASVTTPVLSMNQSIQVSVAMATVFALLQVTVNAPARIRMYSTKASQVSDLGRLATAPIVPGSENGIIADFLLVQPGELTWTCSPAVMGFNNDGTRVSTIYVTVTNPVGSSNVITASFSYAVLIT